MEAMTALTEQCGCCRIEYLASMFKKLFLFFAAIIFVGGFQSVAQVHADTKVIAYFSGRQELLDSIDLSKITHLIFCFAHLDGHNLRIDDAKDSAMLKRMVALKSKKSSLKVMISLGGWGGCETCSDGFFTKEGRGEFAQSVKKVSEYFGADGLDLDWEYPTIRLDNDIDSNPVHKTAPEDYDNFTDLVRQLREVMGKNYILSFAAGGFNTYLQKSVNWKEVMKVVDFVNLMSYDLINGYSTETGHHTALYSTPRQKESTDNAVQYLLKIGVKPGQVIIGAAFYARIWENVPPAKNGLYQQGKFKKGMPFRQFSTGLTEAQGFRYYWDSTAQAPYSYNAAEKLFATYDDAKSIELKTKYVLDHKLGGIMFWELASDRREQGLLDVIHNTLKGDLHTYSSLGAWEQRKKLLRQCITEKLALDKLPQANSQIRWTAERKHQGYSVRNFALETVPGLYVCGSVYQPAAKKKYYPLVLAPNGHFTGGRYHENEQYLCASLAKMGAVTVSYDLFGWGESRLQVQEEDHNTPEAMRIQLLNTRRLLDYFYSTGNIDTGRIAITGASGGGSQTMMNAALDKRIKLSVPVVMLSADFPGGCPCEVGMLVHECGNGTNNAEIAAMAAPHPQLVVSCGTDWTQNVPVKEYPYLRKMYALYGAERAVKNIHFAEEEHNYGIKKRMVVYQFIGKAFGLQPVKTEAGCTIENEKVLFAFGDSGEQLPANALHGFAAVQAALK